jgi:hypothetical protein
LTYGHGDYGLGKALTADYIAPAMQAYGLAAFYPPHLLSRRAAGSAVAAYGCAGPSTVRHSPHFTCRVPLAGPSEEAPRWSVSSKTIPTTVGPFLSPLRTSALSNRQIFLSCPVALVIDRVRSVDLPSRMVQVVCPVSRPRGGSTEAVLHRFANYCRSRDAEDQGLKPWLESSDLCRPCGSRNGHSVGRVRDRGCESEVVRGILRAFDAANPGTHSKTPNATIPESLLS